MGSIKLKMGSRMIKLLISAFVFTRLIIALRFLSVDLTTFHAMPATLNLPDLLSPIPHQFHNPSSQILIKLARQQPIKHRNPKLANPKDLPLLLTDNLNNFLIIFLSRLPEIDDHSRIVGWVGCQPIAELAVDCYDLFSGIVDVVDWKEVEGLCVGRHGDWGNEGRVGFLGGLHVKG